MSRSIWAWTRSRVVVGDERLVRTVSSLTPLWVVAASTVLLTLSPVALGKVGTPHTRALAGPAKRGAPELLTAAHHNSHNPNPSPKRGRSQRSGGVLAFGSGYGTPAGSQGVKALQRRLAALGYQPGPIDGRYGPLTDAAVIRFQAAHRLTADGIAGVHTLAALATAQPVLYPGEGYGSRGSREVRALQRHLVAAGFSPGPIDGRYGRATARAVTRFQIARHLRPDGVAGAQTLGRLGTPHLRPTQPQRHRVHPRPSTGPRSTGPSAARPTGPAQGARQISRRPGGHSSGSFPLLWIILLAAALAVLLASVLWHRRGAGGDVPENTPIPVPLPEGAVEPSDPRSEHRSADHEEGAAAFRLGLLLEHEGDHVGAEDAFRRADERGHPEAALNLGLLLVQEGDSLGSKAAFRRADERGHPVAAFNLALVLLHEGDRMGAKEAFCRAAERGHPDAAFDLGALLLQDGDRAGAEEAFRYADQQGDAGAACNLGVLLEQRGDVSGAMEAYRRADERGHGVGACNLGALLEQHGDVAAAKAAYLRADERGDSGGAYHLGALLEREGDRVGAKDAYRRADQRGHAEGACNLGLLLKDEGDRVGAVGALQRAGERGSGEVVKVARAALVGLDPDEEREA